MATTATVRLDERGRIAVTGDLLFAGAVAACDAGRALVAAAPGSTVEVSLAGLGRINSVTAVVLVEWQRAARAAGKRLAVADVPPRLAGILELSGLGDVLVTAGS
ncbi:MAG: STAS domain-containing protein [Pseudomonadota bacterium]